MDRYISSWPSEPDEDLRLCIPRGVAYQAEVQPFDYGESYFYHYASLEGSEVGARLNAARVAMVQRHASEGARVLDIGAGSGAFVKAARSWGLDAHGFDINPRTVQALKDMGAFCEDPAGVDVFTFWDSIEHIPDPSVWLDKVPLGAVVIAAVPVFRDLRRVRESKHYKPNEHLRYFTPGGFDHWMQHYGFELVEVSDHEVEAGRESIGAYAFRKVQEAQ